MTDQPAGAVDPARILIICTANIARSPLAEVVLRAHADTWLLDPTDVEIRSAGIHARDGDQAAEGSRYCAEMWDLNLDEHRSRPVAIAELEAADLVITMTTRHQNWIVQQATGLSRRTFTWPEFVRLLGEAKIPDAPNGADRVRAAVLAANQARPMSLHPAEPEDVEDPYGGPREGFVAMANELADGADVIAPALFTTRVPVPHHVTGAL